MLRRYVIVNGVSTVVLYGALWAFLPSMSSLTDALSNTLDSFVAGHTFLGPVLHRMVTVSADVAALQF